MANAIERQYALRTLQASQGWALFLERHQQAVLGELDKKLHDIKTPPEETTHLKHARVYLTEQYSPEKILTKMLQAAENEAKREQNEIDALNRAQKPA
jgi:hypothetical protein